MKLRAKTTLNSNLNIKITTGASTDRRDLGQTIHIDVDLDNSKDYSSTAAVALQRPVSLNTSTAVLSIIDRYVHQTVRFR